MNLSIIHSFIADQRVAKQFVLQKLGISVDIPALEWASQFTRIRQSYDECPFADTFRPHGYGLELQLGDLYIDYDYSATGRADGFDSWRIFVYIMAGQFDNRGPDKYISGQIDNWIDALSCHGRIQRLDNLYYFTDGP